MMEAKYDFWCIAGKYNFRNYVMPRRKTYVLEEEFPRPVTSFDVLWHATTDLHVSQEKHIDDYSSTEMPHDQTHGSVLQGSQNQCEISESQNRSPKKQCTTGPDNSWPEHSSSRTKCSERDAKKAREEEEPTFGRRTRANRKLFFESDDHESDQILKTTRRQRCLGKQSLPTAIIERKQILGSGNNSMRMDGESCKRKDLTLRFASATANMSLVRRQEFAQQTQSYSRSNAHPGSERGSGQRIQKKADISTMG